MKRRLMPIAIALGAGLAFWAVDALIDFFRLPDAKIADLLLFDVPLPELLLRAGVLTGAVIIGVFVSRLLVRRARARQGTEQADDATDAKWDLSGIIDPAFKDEGELPANGLIADAANGGFGPGATLGDANADAASSTTTDGTGRDAPTVDGGLETSSQMDSGAEGFEDASDSEDGSSSGHHGSQEPEADAASTDVENDERATSATTNDGEETSTEESESAGGETELDAEGALPTSTTTGTASAACGPRPDEVIQEACNDLFSSSSYHTAWIAIRDDTGRFVAAAGSGIDASMPTLMERLKRGTLPTCVMNAQLRRDLVLTESGSASCAGCPVRPLHDGRSVITARLEHDGGLLGILSVSMRPRRARDAGEQQRIREIANGIADELARAGPRASLKDAAADNLTLACAAADETDAAIVISPAGTVEHVNPPFLALWGFEDRQEVCGRELTELWASSEKIREMVSALDTDDPWEGALTLRREDGTSEKVDARARVLTNEGGEPIGALISCPPLPDEAGSALDATQDAAGRAAEDSTAGRRTDGTPASRTETTGPVASQGGRSAAQEMAAGPGEASPNPAHRDAPSGTEGSKQETTRAPAGTNEEAGSARPGSPAPRTSGATGDAGGIAPTVVVPGPKHLGDEEAYWNFLEAAGIAALTVDGSGLVSKCNTGIERLLGYRIAEVNGQPVDALIRWEEDGRTPESLKKILQSTSSQTADFVLSGSGGTTVDVSVRFVPLPGGAGGWRGTVCLIEDVSDRARTSKEIGRLREQTEQYAAAETRTQEERSRERGHVEQELSKERERAEAALAEQRKAQEELAVERKAIENHLSQHGNAKKELSHSRREAEELLAAQLKAHGEVDKEKLRADRAQAEIERLQAEQDNQRNRIDDLTAESQKAREELDRQRQSADDQLTERKRILEELAREREEAEKLRAGWSEAEEVLSRERTRAEQLLSEREKAREALSRERDQLERLRTEHDETLAALAGAKDSGRERSRGERKAEKELTGLTEENLRLTEELETTRGKLESALGDLETARFELEAARRETERMTERVRSSAPGSEALEEELEKERERAERHHDELRRVAEELTFERKKAENYLSESRCVQTELEKERERADRYVDLAGAIFVTLSVDQTVCEINERGRKVLGASGSEIVGRNWFDGFVPERERAEAKTTFQRLISGDVREIEGFRSLIRTGDGHERVVVWNTARLSDEQGKPMGALFAGVDVTDTEGAGHELSMLGAVPSQISDAILVTDLDFRVVHANDAAAQFYGRPTEALVGKTPQLVTDGERARELQRAIREAVSTNGVWVGEHSVTRPDGTVIACDTRITPLREGTSDEPTSYVFVQRDVTTHSRRERLLGIANDAAIALERSTTPSEVLAAATSEFRKASLTCFAMLVDDEREGIALKHIDLGTGDGGGAGRSRAIATTILSSSAEEFDELRTVLEKREIVMLQSSESLAKRLVSGESGPATEAVETLFGRGRFALAPLEAGDEVYGIFVAGSESLGEDQLPLIGVLAEIVGSAWQRATRMEEAERGRASLEIVHAQLERAWKTGDVAEVATGVVGQIEKQLTAITGFADLLVSRHGSDDPTREDIGRIKNAVAHASTLTSQLLSVGKGRPPESDRLDVNAVVRNMDETLRRLVGGDVQVVTVLRPRLNSILMESELVERIVADLSLNARDAMPHGGTITIRSENLTLDENRLPSLPGVRPGRHVRLTVEDTGEGLDAESLERVFDPSFTPTLRDGRTTRNLSAVHDIVEGHGGWIDVQTESGRGTTFTLYVPALEPLTEEGTTRRTVRMPEERILLVEDEDDLRRTAADALAEQGYSVVEASSAEEALKVFTDEGGRFDLVFSNLVLPAMSGMQLADELLTKEPGLRVLLSTGRTDEEHQDTLIKEKGLRLLQKPYEMHDLLRSVKLAMRAQ